MLLPWRPLRLPGGRINTSLTPAEADRLRELADGRQVLEVGSAFGYSAIVMAQVAEHVLAVDPHTAHDSLGVMRANLLAHGCEDRVSIVAAASPQVLCALRHARARFGLIFIDGDHSEHAVAFDVACASALLAKRGTVACHDYGEDTCAGVKAALDRLGKPDRLTDTLWERRRT